MTGATGNLIGFALRRAAALGCGAVLLWCVNLPVLGAIFDDAEARRQIAVEKKRIDDLGTQINAQQQAISARLAKLEEGLKGQPVLDLFTQIEAVKLEMSKLRGQIEVLNNNIENTAKRQRDMYTDLDTRLRRFEQQGLPTPAASPPATAAPANVTGASPPGTATPPPPVATKTAANAPAAPAATVANVDGGTETRSYETAQSQRRIGNYQGAIVSFQNFVKQYPKSTLAPRAQYWIGDSYFNLRDFKLAIASQQALISSYPDSPSVPEAMLNIASSQIEMGDSTVGRKALEDLVTKFPISDAADKAKRRLAALKSATSASKP